MFQKVVSGSCGRKNCVKRKKTNTLSLYDRLSRSSLENQYFSVALSENRDLRHSLTSGRVVIEANLSSFFSASLVTNLACSRRNDKNGSLP